MTNYIALTILLFSVVEAFKVPLQYESFLDRHPVVGTHEKTREPVDGIEALSNVNGYADG